MQRPGSSPPHLSARKHLDDPPSTDFDRPATFSLALVFFLASSFLYPERISASSLRCIKNPPRSSRPHQHRSRTYRNRLRLHSRSRPFLHRSHPRRSRPFSGGRGRVGARGCTCTRADRSRADCAFIECNHANHARPERARSERTHASPTRKETGVTK